MVTRLRAQLRPSVWQSMALVAGVTLAYGLDYLFNLVIGRMLSPVEFSIVVAVAGVGQVLVVSSRVIQTVVTRYIARFQAGDKADGRIASFFQAMFRASWRWGSVALLLLLLLSWPLARFLQIDEVGPVMALAAATLLMVVRPVVGGALQGLQQFSALSAVQITQALLRLLLGALLVWLGWGAFGAMISLPLASGVALWVGWRLLKADVKGETAVHHQVHLPELFSLLHLHRCRTHWLRLVVKHGCHFWCAAFLIWTLPGITVRPLLWARSSNFSPWLSL